VASQRQSLERLEKRKGNPEKNRFVFCQDTRHEFNLREEDIPVNMREQIPEDLYTNHVDQNIRLAPNYNDIKKVVFLSKMKLNIENQLQTKYRSRENVVKDRRFYKSSLSKWDDFRERRQKTIEEYLKVKRRQGGLKLLTRHIFCH